MATVARLVQSCFLAGLLSSVAWAELRVGTVAPAFSTQTADL